MSSGALYDGTDGIFEHRIGSMEHTSLFRTGFCVYSALAFLEGASKKAYELLNLRALKLSPVNRINIFLCIGVGICVEFQRVPLKFHTKCLTHTFLYNVDI